MHPNSAIALVVALLAAVVACRRRWVRVLGKGGRSLAPAFLLIVWFIGLGLGQATGSVAGMAWAAALPVVAIAGYALARTRPLRKAPLAWTVWDFGALSLIAAFLLAYCGNDNYCHYSVVGAYLRGNIPPTAQDDPTRPLRYHPPFDAAAAVVVNALGVSPELALDLVGIGCVFATMSSLQPLGRVLFLGAWARQCSRLFFVLGFGPIYLNDVRGLLSKLVGGRPEPLGSFLFHGHSTQSFIEALPRRPMGLNFALFSFLLAAVLPRLSSSMRPRGGPLRPAHPACLLAVAFLLPQVSEDMAGLAALIVGGLGIVGALSWRWVILWGGATLAAAPFSGVLASMLTPSPPTTDIPRIAPAWPPTLPLWADPASGSSDAAWAVIRAGVPLVSTATAWALLAEWGPWFLGGLLLGLRDPRRRMIVGLVIVGLILACGLRLEHWIKADLDRFLFPGTCAGFLLVAGWIEILENVRDRGRLARRWFLLASSLVIVSTMLGPVGYAVRYIVPYLAGKNSRLPVSFSGRKLSELRSDLAAVGPRDLIQTDARSAQNLILAGFVVKAPLAPGFSIGIVQSDRFDTYLAANPTPRPTWLFLPEDDPRVVGLPPVARRESYVLVRAR